jgi:hypothetical protein
MEYCNFIGKCHFLNDKIMRMPIAARKLVDTYCEENFDQCSIHTIAITDSIDNVPKHVCPDDTY